MQSPVLARSRALVVLALAAIAAVMIAPAASAHTDLKESNPAEGASVTLLDEVSLTFTSDLLEIGNELSIVDAEGAAHALEPTFPEPTSIAATVDVDLPEGDTQLVWRVVAEDGHPIEGVIDFTYAPEGDGADATASAAPTPSPSDSPSKEARAATPSASASAVPLTTDASASPSPTAAAEADDEGGVPAWIWWVVGAAVIGTGVTALVAVNRR
ncbi:copper resistance CopC family protein [Demequina sp. NBRC 110057]|uniref:copper resistance CopC family protein n=1 Tax=Demequina sp. NBRC 110057 TaxID=1570346 RepID=UPI00135672DB|nr:copper resistance CopC family protein [Demequina sp. NBRC 110057]